MRDLWWTIRLWDKIFFEDIGFSLSVLSAVAPKCRVAQKSLGIVLLLLNIVSNDLGANRYIRTVSLKQPAQGMNLIVNCRVAQDVNFSNPPT
jgi:hypothetical protein